MRKRWFLVLSMLAVLALVVACSSPEPTATSAPAPADTEGASTEGAGHTDAESAGHTDAEDVGHMESENGGHIDAEGGHHEASGMIEGAREVRLVATEFAYEPATITVTEGEPVSLVLENQGKIEHEIEVGAFDMHLHVQPGETMMGGFVPNQSGTFSFACEIPGHKELGMVVTMIVEPSTHVSAPH